MNFNLVHLFWRNKVSLLSLYFFLLSGVIILSISLCYFDIDITSQSRGIVVPQNEAVYLTSLNNGVIQQLKIKNNLKIFKGDTLLVLSKEKILSQSESQDFLLKDKQTYEEDMNLLIAGRYNSLKSSLGLSKFSDYSQQLNTLKEHVELAQLNYDRQKILFEKGIIASADFEQHLYNLSFANQKVLTFQIGQKAQWSAIRSQLQDDIIMIQSGIRQLGIQGQEYIITAPITGTLNNTLPVTINSNILAGQQLAIISPDDDLIVENTVLPSDIGLLRIGQEVLFQFDAFNYNQWGMIEGNVIEIDNNITISETGSYFKVKSRLNKKSLTLKNGYKANIKKGMTVTTRFVITRRKISDLLFDKVDDWFNPQLK